MTKINKTTKLDIECVKGDNFIMKIQLADKKGNIISLDNYSFFGGVINDYDNTILENFIISYETISKTLSIELDYTQTNNLLEAKQYLYYVKNDKFTLLYGSFDVIGNNYVSI